MYKDNDYQRQRPETLAYGGESFGTQECLKVFCEINTCEIRPQHLLEAL